MQLSEFGKSRKHLVRAGKLSPGNEEIRQELQKLDRCVFCVHGPIPYLAQYDWVNKTFFAESKTTNSIHVHTNNGALAKLYNI